MLILKVGEGWEETGIVRGELFFKQPVTNLRRILLVP
jgi:hypothetical protein